MITKNKKLQNIINWTAITALMIFYGGTWLSPYFYHITEIYATLIVFACLAILFFANVDFIDALKKRELSLYALIVACPLALLNLFIIGSNKGCILIITNFLLLWYMADKVKFSKLQMRFMYGVFVLVFLVWIIIDLAFSYNSNTGASVTVFTFMCVMTYLVNFTRKKEIYGLITTLIIVRVINLVLWHLARGAFVALFLFLFFYYVIPKKWWADVKKVKALSLFSTLGSIVFVFIYVAAAATGFNFKMPFFYKNLFSGREQIWMEIFDKLKQHPLTGIGSGYELESFFEYNIHNVMYDILAVHGVIVFVLAMYIILNKMFMIPGRLSSAVSSDSPARVNLSKVAAVSAIYAMAIESFIDMDFSWAPYAPVVLFMLLIIFNEETDYGKDK
ncbi:MAG: O-antigen ligase family protein [Lachnospiraceae bacterium]|nr:O-antigen ligase family protein [Lachnospiraceae bacterium]